MNEASTEARWYVVHTYSGYENKVKTSLEKAIENRGMSHYFFDIQIPTEMVVEQDGDKTREFEDKVFPSYVLIKMIMSDESWHVVRNIRGVTGFVGPGSKPIPLSDAEVAALGFGLNENAPAEAATVKLAFEVGDTVKIEGGLLEGSTAVVEEISADRTKVRVTASMFGRNTSIELDIKDVKRA
ncbi:MAG: transcription termination/antitermination factor NusG [Clostridia bacterium]|nr:transcription termination/antitermination factor NusG [Clostridia bacterium]